ncbi:MAG: YdeI/OmpD-associated family protein [Pseudomonadota bacterium]
MSDYLSFEGRIIPMIWGENTYTVLPLPDDIAATLQAQNAKRVEGEINDHPINLALTKAPVIDGIFLYTGKSLLDRIGVSPDEPLEIRLRPAPADQVDVPDDVATALRAADMTTDWDSLSPGKRRGVLHQITSAKRAETREKRIAKMLTDLQAGAL